MSTLPKQKVITNTDLEAIVTKQVQDTMAQSSQSLLGDLDRLITDKLSGQVTEMRRLRDAVDTKPHKFRKRGNEEQFNINSKVLEKIFFHLHCPLRVHCSRTHPSPSIPTPTCPLV